MEVDGEIFRNLPAIGTPYHFYDDVPGHFSKSIARLLMFHNFGLI